MYCELEAKEKTHIVNLRPEKVKTNSSEIISIKALAYKQGTLMESCSINEQISPSNLEI